MPLQPSPPYNSTSEPRQINKWLDVNAQNGALKRASNYITLSAFNIVYTWNGYSDIIGIFTFEGPNNFSLTNINRNAGLQVRNINQFVGAVIGADSGGGMI